MCSSVLTNVHGKAGKAMVALEYDYLKLDFFQVEADSNLNPVQKMTSTYFCL